MADRQMTQLELAEKYEADGGTMSQALSRAGMFQKTKGKTYPEGEAVEALIRICHKRAEDMEHLATMWRTKASRIKALYEENVEPAYEDLVPRFEPDTIGERGENP